MVTDDHPTRLWTLKRDAEEIACQVRLVPYGIEVDLLVGGRIVLTRVFATDNEALDWARDKRERRESQGWRPVKSTDEVNPRPVG